MKLRQIVLVGCAATTLCAQEFPVVIDKLEIERAVQAAMAAKDEALAHKDEVLAALKSGELFAKHTAAMDKALFAAHGMNFQFGRAGNTPLTDDEEMKIMAIDSLMQSDAERAIPVVDKIIQNQQASTRLRLRALQSMSRSNSPKAREVVIRVAKDGSNPEMQSRAIRMLGSRENTQNRQLLSEIYASSTNVEVKSQVIHTMADADDWQKLLEIAKTEKNEDLRNRAIQRAGSSRSAGVPEAMVAMYSSAPDTSTRNAILRGLSQQRSAKQLIAVARLEKDPELKRAALQHLARMKGDDVTAYLTELLEK